jgi:hypothetical protein
LLVSLWLTAARKSQSIDPDLLPVAPQRGPINKKTDYAFSFSQHDAEVAPLYHRLRSAGQGDFLGHTTDKTTKRLLLFSGVEVKPENGGKSEATVQLSIWLSAALRHLRRLGQKSRSLDQPDFPYDDLLPMPGFVVVGHDWHGFIARASQQGKEDRVVRFPASYAPQMQTLTFATLRISSAHGKFCRATQGIQQAF